MGLRSAQAALTVVRWYASRGQNIDGKTVRVVAVPFFFPGPSAHSPPPRTAQARNHWSPAFRRFDRNTQRAWAARWAAAPAAIARRRTYLEAAGVFQNLGRTARKDRIMYSVSPSRGLWDEADSRARNEQDSSSAQTEPTRRNPARWFPPLPQAKSCKRGAIRNSHKSYR